MPILLALALFLLVANSQANAEPQPLNEAMRRDWRLCQAGELSSCNRLLRHPLDEHTRTLIEVDREQAQERRIAYVRMLVDVCHRRTNVRACDRALQFNLTASERTEVLELRKAVAQRQAR
jgi:hypothetical protein